MQEDQIATTSVGDVVRRLATLAHFTVLQAWYGRLFHIAAMVLLAVLGIGEAFAAMQVIEGDIAAAAILVTLIRLSVASLLLLHMAFGAANDGVDEMVASLDLSPVILLIGQWLGYSAVGAAAALGGGAVLALYGGPGPAAVWSVSFGAELGVLAAMVLFVRSGLRRPLAVVLVGGAFYVLGRLLPLLLEIAAAGVAEQTPLREFAAFILRVSAVAMPRFDGLAEPGWITTGALPEPTSYFAAIGGALSYAGFALCLAFLERVLAKRR
ncbi:MAG: hypothetical protein VX663_06705 [Pseudomonadota bacterium]|nr:hypothetical protein [Pseudomonadota bacterium]